MLLSSYILCRSAICTFSILGAALSFIPSYWSSLIIQYISFFAVNPLVVFILMATSLDLFFAVDLPLASFHVLGLTLCCKRGKFSAFTFIWSSSFCTTFVVVGSFFCIQVGTNLGFFYSTGALVSLDLHLCPTMRQVGQYTGTQSYSNLCSNTLPLESCTVVIFRSSCITFISISTQA